MRDIQCDQSVSVLVLWPCPSSKLLRINFSSLPLNHSFCKKRKWTKASSTNNYQRAFVLLINIFTNHGNKSVLSSMGHGTIAVHVGLCTSQWVSGLLSLLCTTRYTIMSLIPPVKHVVSFLFVFVVASVLTNRRVLTTSFHFTKFYQLLLQ